jgi:hypothetical protein
MKSLQINYLAVLAAAVATFILGAVWYTLFSSQWMAFAGITDTMAKQNEAGAMPFIVSFK